MIFSIQAARTIRRCCSHIARHKKPIGHTFLEMPDHMRLAARNRDRQHVAFRGPELDDKSSCGSCRSSLPFPPVVYLIEDQLTVLFERAQTFLQRPQH
jgi:hypothetical protein